MNERSLTQVLVNLYREYWEDNDDEEDDAVFDWVMVELHIKELLHAMSIMWPKAFSTFKYVVEQQTDFNV